MEEIKIKIEYETINNDNTPSPPKVIDEDFKPVEVEEDKKNVLKSIVANQSFQIAKQLTMRAISNTYHRYTNMKEDYMTERNVNATVQVLNKAVNIGSMAVGGFMVGGPVGAFASVGVGAIGTALEIQTNLSKHYSTLNSSNMNVDFARTRAGLTDNGRGTEN